MTNEYIFGQDPFKDQKQLLGELDAPVIIDGGAYVGATVVRYRSEYPGAKIYAFEGCPDNLARLRGNLVRTESTEICGSVLGESAGTCTLYRNGYAPTHSILPRPLTGKRYYPEKAAGVDTIEVSCVSLDGFSSSAGLEYIDILKLDVQGAEGMVLRGAMRLLEQQKIGLLFLEACFVPLYENGVLYYELAEFLSRYGYTLFRTYDHEYAKDGQMKFCNAIFVSDRIRVSLGNITEA